jgi:hypothetical protein
VVADPLLGPIEGARHEVFGGVDVDVVAAGSGRIKRLVYPPGSRWSTDRKPLVGTEYCMHSFTAPEVVVLEPGHDTWVVGDEPAVLIQFDFERETTKLLGLPERHRHS